MLFRSCAFNEADNEDVVLQAVAELGTSDCKNPPQGKVAYALTIQKIGETAWTEELAGKNADLIEIIGGNTQERDFTAANHATRSIAAHLSDDCSDISYKAHYRCNNCGKNFTTKSATKEAHVSLEPQGHLYGDPEYNWAGAGQVEAQFECTRSECPVKREVPDNAATVDPEKPGKIRVFMAEITGGPYPGDLPTCKAEGTEYYDTRIVLPEGESLEEFAGSEFEGDIIANVPMADHKFTGQDGSCEWCENKSGEVVKVAFYGRTGSLIQSEWMKKSAAVELTKIPVAPNQIGYTFKGYSINGAAVVLNRSAAANSIKTAFGSAGADGIRVELKYEPINQKGSVKTNYITGTVNSPTELQKAKVDSDLTLRTNHPVKAPLTITKDTTTYYFSYWADEKGVQLSASANYEIYIDKAETKEIYAVYVDDEEDKEQDAPSVAATSVYTSTVDNVNKITFTFTMSDLGLYEECEFVDSGVLYAKGVAADFTGESMTYENSSKAALNGKKTNTLTVKVASDTEKIATKGYLRYRIGQEIFVVYSQAVVTDYNRLKAAESAN